MVEDLNLQSAKSYFGRNFQTILKAAFFEMKEAIYFYDIRIILSKFNLNEMCFVSTIRRRKILILLWLGSTLMFF